MGLTARSAAGMALVVVIGVEPAPLGPLVDLSGHRLHVQGSLGTIPLVVLTRAEGGYGDGPDVSAARLDAECKRLQQKLVQLSRSGRQVIVAAGHDMHLEAPDVVSQAIRDMVEAARRRPSPRRRSRVATP